MRTENAIIHPAVRRFLLILLGSVLVVWLGSELAFDAIKGRFERRPEEIALTIPSGAAVRVAAGHEEPGIPAELDFVVGDTLVVYNDDDVAHELGPLFIPAGASARLVMESANVFQYDCSFRPSSYLGLTVREVATTNVRLIAIAYVSPATAIIIFLYSLAVKPIEDRKSKIDNR
ncbi:MAG TPA: hypothetical protein VMN57_14635 [Anaerolineales bacterium]|nr:hypothetical protein [Anaerolineales bacterium]